MFENLFDLFNRDESEQDKKLVDYGLDSNERKAMKRDNYDYWNFDEEDLEEDDFYYEDEGLETSSGKTSSENFFEDDDEEEE